MKRMILLCGLPASGKTKFHKDNPELFKGVVRLSLDDFRRLMTGKDFHLPFEPVVHAWIDMTGRYHLSQGQSILIDATAVRSNLRTKWVKLAKEYDFRTEIYFINTPYFTCIERDQKRDRHVGEEIIKRMSEQFDEITPEEGWDKIEIIELTS